MNRYVIMYNDADCMHQCMAAALTYDSSHSASAFVAYK